MTCVEKSSFKMLGTSSIQVWKLFGTEEVEYLHKHIERYLGAGIKVYTENLFFFHIHFRPIA